MNRGRPPSQAKAKRSKNAKACIASSGLRLPRKDNGGSRKIEHGKTPGVFIISFLVMMMLVAPACAACLSPAGVAGDILYNTNSHVPQYCDGTDWLAFVPEAGDGGAGCSNPSGVEGDLTFNRDLKTMQYCEGDKWVSVGTCSDYKTGSVAHWIMNEGSGATTADISGGGHTGTLVGSPAWQTSGGRTWLDFNGTSQSVAIADHDDFTLDAGGKYSWSQWINSDNLAASGGWATIFSHTQAGPKELTIFAHTLVYVELPGGSITNGISVVWNDDTNFLVTEAENVLTAGAWYHVIVTYDGTLPQNSRFRIYVNGEDVTGLSSGVGTLASFNPTDIRIGGNALYPDYFDGKIDDVRFFDRKLSSSEIREIYLEGLRVHVEASMIAHWPLDEPAGMVAADISGGDNNGVLTNMAGTEWTAGKVGGALEFSQENTYVSVAGESSFDFERNQPFSIAAWVYRDTNTTEDDILEKLPLWGAGWRGYGLWLENGANVVKFMLASSTVETIQAATPADSLPVGAWHQIVATYDGSSSVSGIKIYIDGQEQILTTGGTTLTNTILNDVNVLIGSDAPGETCCGFDGKIDDVRVYSRALSAAEVGILYSDAAPGYGCTEAGAITYNADHSLMQYCDGSRWVAIGQDCRNARPYDFQFNTAIISPSTLVTSNIVQILGISNPVDVSVSGQGSPQYRICTAADCSAVSQDWTSGSSVQISNGQWLQLRMTSGSSGQVYTATAYVGTASEKWEVTTNANLVAHWSLNEGGGTTIGDSSGNNLGGSTSGSPAWQTGSGLTWLDFNGSSQYIAITDNASFTLVAGGKYTWSLWFNSDSLTTADGWPTLFSHTLAGNHYVYAYAHTASDTVLPGGNVTSGISVWWVNTTSARLVTEAENVISTGAWYHLAITYDGTLSQSSRFKIYINGSDVTGSSSSSGTIAGFDPTNIRIAHNALYATEYFDGKIDDVRFYNRNLSSSEISAIYSAGR